MKSNLPSGVTTHCKQEVGFDTVCKNGHYTTIYNLTNKNAIEPNFLQNTNLVTMTQNSKVSHVKISCAFANIMIFNF